jgi:hypothetical protein
VRTVLKIKIMIATSKLCSKERHYKNRSNKQKAESDVFFGLSKEKIKFGKI